MPCHVLDRPARPPLAYTADLPNPAAPTVLFLPGYRSDMSGTKASALADWTQAHRINFVRFDYSGHGESGGAFETLVLSDWVADTLDMLDQVVPQGPVILVGSSMGGWIALRAADLRRDRVRALIGIAAAPDFTKEMSAKLTAAQRAEMAQNGVLRVPSTLGDQPYVITSRLIEDGENHLVLSHPRDLAIPMTLIQGRLDPAVPYQTPAAIAQAYPACDIKTILIEDGDHSLSRPQDMAVLEQAILEQIRSISG